MKYFSKNINTCNINFISSINCLSAELKTSRQENKIERRVKFARNFHLIRLGCAASVYNQQLTIKMKLIFIFALIIIITMIIIDSCESGGSAIANYGAYLTHYKMKKKRRRERIKKLRENREKGIFEKPKIRCDPYFRSCP